MATARQILERGDCVVIFPEGTRVRPGGLGSPKRGVGRLALETGAPVVPVAVHRAPSACAAAGGSARTRSASALRARAARSRAWRSPRRSSREPSPSASGRAWHCSGSGSAAPPPLRRAAIVGAGSWGTSLAVALARAGLQVELGCRTPEQAATLRDARENEHYLPGVTLPDAVSVKRVRQARPRARRHRLLRRPRGRAARRGRRPRGAHRRRGRRARALEGPRRAAGHAAQRLRGRARPRARRGLPRRARPCGRRAGQRRRARRRVRRRRLRRPARPMR